jgi:hypothetical protein
MFDKCRVKLVGRDYTPLGHPLVDPERSGMSTQHDLGKGQNKTLSVTEITDLKVLSSEMDQAKSGLI